VGIAKASNIVAVPAAPPVFDDAPMVTSDNAAGYVDSVRRSILGVENCVTKTVTPLNASKITFDPFLHFRVRSSADEHIRFRKDALNLMFFATYKNQSDAAHVDGADQTKEATAKRLALDALNNKPFMWMDPSVGATAFFSRVEVLVDNVPVNSNFLLGNLWLQYTRVCEIFNSGDGYKPRPVLKSTLEMDNTKNEKSAALREATRPFSYGGWKSVTGRRLDANLRGVFPFEFKNEAAASADNLKEPNYYFPPNTTFDFRFHFHPDKLAAVFHPEIANNMSEYMAKRETVGVEGYGVSDYSKWDIRYQITSAFLEYESVTLRPEQKIRYLGLLAGGAKATYRYDVVRGQHVTLPSGQSYVDVPFQIAPFARLAYIMFLPDWSVVSMPTYRRPLGGISRFPEKCTKLSLVFAGSHPLITQDMERLGFPGEQHHTSQRVLFNYLKSHHVWPGTFDDLFPGDSTTIPFNQIFYVDLRESMSDKTETLNIKMDFADGGGASPANRQIAVLSVHSTGEVVCSHGGGPGHYDWRWESKY
jgi:hypothetical protein